ncbi:LysR family transcriptional regulator [Bosea sp. RAF48]|uniref:LysR family transcriptional regulator n=1 Tax=Bosea sp. RAF48 TaxID=3237480 RepID=UPI003F91B280
MNARRSLDPEAIETFVLAADLRSFTKAAAVLNTTQAAVSLRLKRLEAHLGQRLLERTPRRISLTAAGERFLGPAREFLSAHRRAAEALSEEAVSLNLGVTHHLVGPELTRAIQAAGKQAGGVKLSLRTGLSGGLLERFDAGELDAVIILRHDASRRDGEILAQARFGWFCAPDFSPFQGEPLPLAVQRPPCNLRSMAIGALDAAGTPWREAFIGEGAASVAAAASAGLGLAPLARCAAPAGLVEAGSRFKLPPLPARPIVLHSAVSRLRAAALLNGMAATFRAEAQR